MKFFLKIILPIFILFLIGCKKDHSILGVDVQPTVDDLNAEHINGLPVTAHTLPYDSIASFNTQYKFIGSNNDPYFGRTDIGIYLNANIDGPQDFGVNTRISSAEIILAVDPLAFAGDKFASLTYSVFPLIDNLSVDSIYYTGDTRHHITSPIGVYTTSFTVADNAQAIIKIKIDSVYAEGLLHDTQNLTTNAVFQAKYKGYYIAASIQNSSDEGIIYTANLDDDLSGLHLHYLTGLSTTDSIINFKFSFAGSRYNTVKFSPLQTLKNQFQDSTLGATNLYLKGMGMTKLKVQIPFLVNHSDSFKIAVNRAELILNVDPNFVSANRYLTPPNLVLLSIDSVSRETYAQDLLSSTDYSRFDGTYDETNNRYVFNLAREAQLIFGGKKKNRGFYLVIANANNFLSYTTTYNGKAKELTPVRRDLNYERVIFAGSNNATLKPQFNLNYIRFKND